MSCFWKHKWGKWEVFEVTIIPDGAMREHKGQMQKRYCEECNKVETTGVF